MSSDRHDFYEFFSVILSHAKQRLFYCVSCFMSIVDGSSFAAVSTVAGAIYPGGAHAPPLSRVAGASRGTGPEHL